MAIKLIRNRRSHRVEAFNDSDPVESVQLNRFLAKAGFQDVTPAGGGSSAQVFEVTDLVIPAGTDWSEPNEHVLGEVEVASDAYVIPRVFIEAEGDAAGQTDNNVVAIKMYSGSSAIFGPGGRAPAPGYPCNWGSNPVMLMDLYPDASGHPPATLPLKVTLSTGGVTDIEITILQARASFLVI